MAYEMLLPYQPQPTTMKASAGRTGEGKPIVLVEMATAGGQVGGFFTPHEARQAAAMIVKTANEADGGGIVVATELPPNR